MSQLNRGQGPLPPFVSMMPEVVNGSPRFVEQSHGSEAGWLGPQYAPLRIDDDGSKSDYLGEFALKANLPDGRMGDRRGLLHGFVTDDGRRRTVGHPTIHASECGTVSALSRGPRH